MAGVWWASMSCAERIRYSDYLENKDYIEGNWVKYWDDRMNELVFIGQDMDKVRLMEELESCLLNEVEVPEYLEGKKFEDPFQIG